MQRIVGDDTDAFSPEPRESDNRALAEARLEFEERVLVDDAFDDFSDVVNLRAFLGQDSQDVLHALPRARGYRCIRRRLAMMARKVGEEPLDRVKHLLFGVDHLIDKDSDLGWQAPADKV